MRVQRGGRQARPGANALATPPIIPTTSFLCPLLAGAAPALCLLTAQALTQGHQPPLS